jgi:peptide/nickel transport system substrate-binding protein
MRGSVWTTAVTGAAALALGLAACGGSDSSSSSGGGEQSSNQGAPVSGKQGGKLTALWSNDVDFIDCGQTYYQLGTLVCNATQKALYGYRPNDATKLVPDLAASPPQISNGGKKVTITLRQGVKFSPPVNRVVTSKDVKYAIERGFFNTVNNGYAGAYFGDLKGAKTGVKPGTKIKGITTPDDHTIVLNLTKGTAGVLAAGALAMPLTAPVPEEYAAKLDAKNPSAYGTNQVATGPYMIENNAQGKAIGYQPGRRIHLVRNRNWDKKLDFKPAYLDEIDNLEGNEDTTVASRRILDGTSMINADFNPPPTILKQASQRQRDQLALVPSGGGRWISMNMTMKPFDDINVRKAVIAGFDRAALRLTRGGQFIGDIPTHFLPPGTAGFEQAGGLKGPGDDFLNTTGKPNMQLAAQYFKKAGYSSGKYEGNEELLMVGDNSGTAAQAAEVAKQNFEDLGFKIRLRLVTHDAMYTKFCNVPSAKVAICPNVGWLKDFADAQTLLDPTFNGENILDQNNSNWSQLDDPKINAAMDKAKVLTDPAQRAQAWANVDKMITAQAPAIPWVWDKDPLVYSKNVNMVADLNSGLWNVAFSSLK